jgi:hypothetical protein
LNETRQSATLLLRCQLGQDLSQKFPQLLLHLLRGPNLVVNVVNGGSLGIFGPLLFRVMTSDKSSNLSSVLII